MTDADYQSFVGEFERLHSALAGYRQKPDEARAKADAYFHALKHLPFSEVVAKADTWLKKETKMPKPAEWASVIVQRPVDLPALNPRDSREYLEAERLGYERDPCTCPSCVQAKVHEKPQRFVPEFTEDDTDRKVTIGDRIVTAGHWAHGYELASLYKARADFWNRFFEIFGSMTFPDDSSRNSRNVVDFKKVGSA